MTLHVHHGPHLGALADALASVLAAPLADPFTPEVVAVPSLGVRDLVGRSLARRLGAVGRDDGVVANVQLVFPSRLVTAALGDPVDADDDPWAVERVAWVIMQVADDREVAVPGWPRDPQAPGADRWARARRVADLFDRYAVQRPRLLQQWAEGLDTDGAGSPPATLPSAMRWQPELWRAVRRRIGRPSLPERLPALLADLRAGDLAPGLPERVAMFGVSAVPPAQLEVMRALAVVRDVHLMVLHPSPVAWRTSPHRLGGGLNRRLAVDVTTHVTNRLLASWGRPSLEARALVNGADAVEHEAAPRPLGATLLATVQRGILFDREPGDALAPADASVQVHACHGASRQVEVLRDALAHLFTDHPDLLPRDVTVVCADLERYAPLIPAVFEQSGEPCIPVRVTDRSLMALNPVAEALDALLAVARGRITALDVLALARLEPIQRSIGLSDDDVTLLGRWIDGLSANWGLDERHRTAWGIPDDVCSGTWRSVVDRLLVGAAMPAPTLRAVLHADPHDISTACAPFDDLGGDDVQVAGRLAELVARLTTIAGWTADELPVAVWCERFTWLAGAALAVTPDDEWQSREVLATLDDVRADAAGAADIRLGLAEAHAVVRARLGGAPRRFDPRSGAVTVTSPASARGVPARVLCVLGLDDIAGGAVDGDDVLGLSPCVGERDAAAEQRHALLDVLVAARDAVIVTCTGNDPLTNAPVPLTAPLVELLDVVAACVDPKDGCDPLDGVLVRHPRHGFDERAVTAPRDAGSLHPRRPWAFHRSALDAALAARRGRRSAAERVSWQLPPVEITTATLGELREALVRPARVLLRDRLEVALPGDDDLPCVDIPLATEPLQRSILGQALARELDAGAPASDELLAAWRDHCALAGGLPPGHLGGRVLDDVATEVVELERALGRLAAPLALPFARDVHVVLDDGTAITGTVPGIAGDHVVRLQFTRFTPGLLLETWLQLAALTAVDSQRCWSAALAARGPSSSPRPVTVRMRFGDGMRRTQRSAAAREVLRTAVDTRRAAMRNDVPLFARTSLLLYEGGDGVSKDAPKAWASDIQYDKPAALVWDGFDLHAVLAEPAREHESHLPAAPGRAHAWARQIWGLYHRTVEGEAQ